MNKQLFSPRCAAMALGLACAAAAQAQLAPFGVTVGETVSHQSNIFRAPAGSETADWLSNTTLRGTFDQAFGRQRAKAFAGVDAGYYKNKTDLNHVGHQVGAEFDWSTVNNLSGSIGVDSASRLYQYGIGGATLYVGKNIETTHHGFGRFQLGGVARWTLLGGVDAVDRSYSATDFAANEVNQWAADLGARYQASPDLSFTALGRKTEGEFPQYGTAGADNFSINTLGLGTNWQISGASNLDLTLGYSVEDHLLQADRSYWNGALRWTWTPPGKVKLAAGLRRDSSANTAVVPGESTVAAPGVLSQSLNTSADLNVTWDATAKISVLSGLQQAENRYDSLTVNNLPTAGSATTRLYSLGLRYKFTRGVDLGCSAAREERTVASAISTVVTGYNTTTLTCMGQVSFQ